MEKTKILKRDRVTECSELRLREAPEGGDSRIIEGYAILFNKASAPLWQESWGEAREIILPDAVTQELLDASDIKFTMFHNRQIILGRSNMGQGTLSYEIDEKGVKFALELPNSPNGDEALSAVKRGDICGCSFAFSTYYYDEDYVSREILEQDGKRYITYYVKRMTGIYDMTLAADPAYPDTSVEARDLYGVEKPRAIKDNRAQISEMRRLAKSKLF